MDALVLFSSDNNHPMAWLLHKEHRHVWCAIRDTDRGHWVSYDWAQGIPTIRCEATADYDLKSHYEEQGLTVIETTVGLTPPHGPLQWNNCVGHVKTLLAIDSSALVPNGLYKHLTKERRSMFAWLRTLSFAPGFGGGAATQALPPTAPAGVGPQSDMSKRAEANLSDKDQKRLKLGKYKPVTKRKSLLAKRTDKGGGPDGDSGSGSGSDAGDEGGDDD